MPPYTYRTEKYYPTAQEYYDYCIKYNSFSTRNGYNDHYSLDEYGTWLVEGETRVADYNAHPSCPIIGYYSGRLRDVIDFILNNKRDTFFCWNPPTRDMLSGEINMSSGGQFLKINVEVV